MDILLGILLFVIIVEIWRLAKYKTLLPPISKVLPLNIYTYYFYFISLTFVAMFIILRLVTNYLLF